jgi:hypothetical protein
MIDAAENEAAWHNTIPIPDWVPPNVAAKVQHIAKQRLPTEQWAILTRLITDPRMRNVWAELTRRRRPSRDFVHPVRQPNHVPLSPDDAQEEALAELLHFALRTAADKRAAGKLSEVEQTQGALRQEAQTLRRLADELTASVAAAPENAPNIPLINLSQYLADAAALRRVADWREALTAVGRGADDPLTITNYRGDPIKRGVQITIACFLLAQFGDRLDGTAATLAEVALDLNKKGSRGRRASRSALSKQKGG